MTTQVIYPADTCTDTNAPTVLLPNDSVTFDSFVRLPTVDTVKLREKDDRETLLAKLEEMREIEMRYDTLLRTIRAFFFGGYLAVVHVFAVLFVLHYVIS